MSNKLRGEFVLNMPTGEDIKVIVNMWALQEYGNETGTELGDLEVALSQDPLNSVPALLWCGVRAACIVDDVELPMTQQRFSVLLGSMDWEEMYSHIAAALSLEDPEAKKKTAKPRTAKAAS